MSTSDLNACLTVCAPLIVLLVGAAVAFLRTWSISQTKTANKSQLLITCENAAKAYVHTHLAQGQLLDYTQHGMAIVGMVRQAEPGWDAGTIETIVQSVAHDINTATLQVTARQQLASATTPQVIMPDALTVAQAFLKLVLPAPLADPPLSAPAPPQPLTPPAPLSALPPLPQTFTGATIPPTGG